METLKLSNTQKKYLAILESGKITEGELISLNSFYNKGKENQSFIDEIMYNNDCEECTLTDEQNTKGYDFLMGLRFTPTGKERLNNPYGYREEEILDNFSHFTFFGFYSENGHYHIRMYNCYSKTGNCFQYYYNGKMNIIG